jgi:hypothetical protein
MTKFLLSIAAAASALAIATPATAQYYGGGYGYNNSSYGHGRAHGRYRYDNGGYGYESNRLVALNQRRLARMHRDIADYVAQGRLDPREAAQLDREVDRFAQELRAVERNGMSGREGAIFDARADRLGEEIQARAGVGYRYGRYRRW